MLVYGYNDTTKPITPPSFKMTDTVYPGLPKPYSFAEDFVIDEIYQQPGSNGYPTTKVPDTSNLPPVDLIYSLL